MADKPEKVEAKVVTLGDFVPFLSGDVQIINECNETLLLLENVDDNVCSLEKTLSKELLSRRLLNQFTNRDRLCMQVEGVEDAD